MAGLFAAASDPARLGALVAAFWPALLGGLLPALVWMAFWMREDREHPEPRRIVVTTFLLGCAAIPGTMVVQLVVSKLFLGGADIHRAAEYAPLAAFATLAAWVIVEELAKVLAAYAGGLSRRDADEPIDAAVYLIAAALGFSAAENFFYVFNELFFHGGQVAAAVMSGSTRAVGATTLHVAAAAILGVFIGYARYAKPATRRALWVGGVALVSLLHLAYNALIIFGGSAPANAAAFAISWAVSLAAIFALERVKALRVESGESAARTTPNHG